MLAKQVEQTAASQPRESVIRERIRRISRYSAPTASPIVPKSIPNYLRVFGEQIQRSSASPAAGGDDLDGLCSAFERVTGWSLRDLTSGPKPQNMELLWSAPVEPASDAAPGQLRVGVAVIKGDSQPGETDLAASAELALAIGQLWRELQQTRETLRRARRSWLPACRSSRNTPTGGIWPTVWSTCFAAAPRSSAATRRPCIC